MAIDSSRFAVLRVVSLMLACDGEIHPREEKWFAWMIGRQDLSPEQQNVLQADLRAPPRVDDVYPNIHPADRERLISWLRIAMGLDGKSDSREERLLKRVLRLEEAANRDSRVGSNRALAESILERDHRDRFWRDLASLGQGLSERVPWWRRFFGPFSG